VRRFFRSPLSSHAASISVSRSLVYGKTYEQKRTLNPSRQKAINRKERREHKEKMFVFLSPIFNRVLKKSVFNKTGLDVKKRDFNRGALWHFLGSVRNLPFPCKWRILLKNRTVGLFQHPVNPFLPKSLCSLRSLWLLLGG
jgi:hypothetical protein